MCLKCKVAKPGKLYKFLIFISKQVKLLNILPFGIWVRKGKLYDLGTISVHPSKLGTLYIEIICENESWDEILALVPTCQMLRLLDLERLAGFKS